MIEILIMDDSADKVSELRQVITPILKEDEIRIDEARSVVEGREMMQDKQYDLLILDMVMPVHEDDEPARDAGSDYLDEIYYNDSIKSPLQIIGLTEYEEEFNAQQQAFRDKLWHLLFYSQKNKAWRKNLQHKITQLHQFKSSLEESIVHRNKYDIGIICALGEEFDQLLKSFHRCQWLKVSHPSLPFVFETTTIHTRGMNQLRIIAACADKPGVCATSVLATALYTVFDVDTVFMTGISAGFKDKDLESDSIIVAESINDYAIGKVVDDVAENGDWQLLREIQQIPASRSLISKVSAFIRDTQSEALIARTVCGPFVMSSQTIMDRLKKEDRKFKALDMEGFALYLAAHTLSKEALWIKAVSDFGDGEKNDDHHQTSASASASFLYEFIREMM